MTHSDIVSFLNNILKDTGLFGNDYSLVGDDIQRHKLLLLDMCDNKSEIQDCINRFYKTFK